MVLDEAHIRIRKLREEKGLTQAEMAETLDIGRTTYVNFETGKTKLYSQTLSKFAAYMGVGEEEILFDAPSSLLESPDAQNEKLSALRNEYEDRLAQEREKLRLLQEENSELKTRIKRYEDLSDYLLSQLNR